MSELRTCSRQRADNQLDMGKHFSVMVPKRGKRRLSKNTKKTLPKKSADYKSVPYVREKILGHGQRLRKDRRICAQTLQPLLRASDDGIVQLLTKDGMLPNWAGRQCPRCQKGTLSKLQKSPTGGGFKYRCNKKGCQVYISPTHLHPWFTDGRGSGTTPLQVQASILLMKLHGVTTSATCQMLSVNHKVVEDMANRLAYARQTYVIEHQKHIKFGYDKGKNFNAIKNWVDVEGDEASFTKTNQRGIDPSISSDKPVVWEQWLGLVQRGHPQSLILERLRPPSTEVRAPGPGAVRKTEWMPLGRKHLEGRHVILHTDAARSYTAKIDGVLHDNVVHAKKRKVMNGKVRWVNPTYVRVVQHKLPNTSKVVKVKAGTQIIDRAWRFIKDRLTLNQSTRAGSRLLRAQIQAAQYQYWFMRDDPWARACDLSKCFMERMMNQI